MNDNLTDRQRQVLDYITRYIQTHGAPPTLREIASHTGTKGTATALHHIEALVKKGYLNRREGNSRGIVLLKKSGRSEATVSIPIVGTVHAGLPQPADESVEGYIEISAEWTRGDDCFFLRVKGDSMIDAHIVDGDMALIRSQSVANNGEIVVARIDGEATLKRFFHHGDHIRLQPENKHMQPILIHENEREAVIVGKLLKTIRSFD